jgi:two-component system response regulator RegX3
LVKCRLAAPERRWARSILAAVTRRTILLVEDEESISEPLARALERDGFAPRVQPTVAQAVDAFRAEAPDLVLLDLMLPDGDGRDVLREIRKTSRVPVIVLTARGDELDRVLGLELGADDYVTKPFSAAELLARIRAVLRRTDESGPAEPRAALEAGDVRLDPDTHVATQAGRQLDLTAKEFDLLRALLGNAGKLVARAQLMEEVWQTSWLGSTKTLDVHVSSLRRKLGDDPASPRYIHTIRGIGFRFAAAEELAD